MAPYSFFSIGNSSSNVATEGMESFSNLWVSRLFEYGVPNCLCWVFVSVQQMQRFGNFNRTIARDAEIAKSRVVKWLGCEFSLDL